MDHRVLGDVSVLLLAAALSLAFVVAGHFYAACAVTALGAMLAGSMAERYRR